MGVLDPYWAILSDPSKRHGGWDIDAFLLTGKAEIEDVLARTATFALPTQRGAALDFGCGVGRLTQALARHFESVVGVDISPSMISRARTLAARVPNCSFVVVDTGSLHGFASDQFDLVYSSLVLQHLENRQALEDRIVEFVRVLRPGGILIFQLPDALPLRRRLQLRPRLYALLRNRHVPADLAYWLGLHPIRMMGSPSGRVQEVVRGAGGSVLGIYSKAIPGGLVDHAYYVTK